MKYQISKAFLLSEVLVISLAYLDINHKLSNSRAKACQQLWANSILVAQGTYSWKLTKYSEEQTVSRKIHSTTAPDAELEVIIDSFAPIEILLIW